MRMKSTGLGRMELLGNCDEISPNGDYLVLHVRTTDPVRWHVRTAISRKDAIQMLKLMLKPSILRYLLSWMLRRDEHEEPCDF